LAPNFLYAECIWQATQAVSTWRSPAAWHTGVLARIQADAWVQRYEPYPASELDLGIVALLNRLREDVQ
jgi:hypothetical protein